MFMPYSIQHVIYKEFYATNLISINYSRENHQRVVKNSVARLQESIKRIYQGINAKRYGEIVVRSSADVFSRVLLLETNPDHAHQHCCRDIQTCAYDRA
jgi:hypothetical protein